MPILIGSRFRVQGSKVTADGNRLLPEFCAQIAIGEVRDQILINKDTEYSTSPHWVKRLYKQDEVRIALIRAVWEFFNPEG